jgi:hypothetical protein
VVSVPGSKASWPGPEKACHDPEGWNAQAQQTPDEIWSIRTPEDKHHAPNEHGQYQPDQRMMLTVSMRSNTQASNHQEAERSENDDPDSRDQKVMGAAEQQVIERIAHAWIFSTATLHERKTGV